MKGNSISVDEFNKLLGEYQYDYVFSESEKASLYNFSISQNLTYERLKNIFNGARKYAITTREDKRFIGRKQIKEMLLMMCKTHDSRTYEQFGMIDKELKQYYRDNDLEYPKSFDRIIKALYDRIQSITNQENSELQDFSDEMYRFIYSFACLYSSFAKYIYSETNEKVKLTQNGEDEFLSMLDFLIIKRILTLKTVENLTVKDVEKLDDFLQELTAGEGVDKNELFTSKEVFALFNKTSSIIMHVSRDKLKEMRSIFKEYFSYISKLNNEDKLLDQSKLNNFTTKNLFLSGGSIFIRKPMVVQDTIDFLMGAPVKEIINSKKRYSENVNIESLMINFPNLRLTQMNSAKHFNLLDNNTSIFASLNLDNLNRVVTSYTEILYSAFNLGLENVPLSEKVKRLREIGYDVDYLVTGDNLVDMFNSSSIANITNKTSLQYKYVVNNLQILSCLLSPSDVQKITSYNFNIITMNSAELLKGVKKVIAKSGSREKLTQNLEEFLNKRVTHYYAKGTGSSPKSRRLVARLSDIKAQAETNQQPDKEHIEIKDLDINLNKLNSLGISLPLDLGLDTTSKPRQKDKVKVTLVNNSDEDVVDRAGGETNNKVDASNKPDEDIVDVIDSIETDNETATEISKEVNIQLVYDQLTDILLNVNKFMQERDVHKMLALSSQIRLKINTISLNIEKLNKLIDTSDEQLLTDIKSVKSHYYNMIDEIEKTLSAQIEVDKTQHQTLVSDLNERKTRKSVSIKKSNELRAEIKEILSKYGVPESLVEKDVENLSEQSKIAFVAEDENYQLETRTTKGLRDDVLTAHSGRTRVKHSLSKLKKSLSLLAKPDQKQLSIQIENLNKERADLQAQLTQVEKTIENKNASLRGRYTRDHIVDENYSTPFMARLKTAIEEQTKKKVEIEKQLKALDKRIKELEDLIDSVGSNFNV